MSAFTNVKKNFGFGCMRLPMENDEVNISEMIKMVDTFLENGFNYFDTASGYHSGKSEKALKECLTSRHPRESYILTNKLSSFLFKTQEDIRPAFERQLEACGVDYFDYYLMHAQESRNYTKYKACRAYETAFELTAEGKVKHVGLSFHDKAEVLRQILTDYPEVEFVQIQFNYVDYDDPSVESRKCYEVCREFGKEVVIMEPVKGGSLVNLPPEAKAVFDALGGGSYASYAIRFAASFEGVRMVLSGMGDMNMMNDNISYMKDFKPLSDDEFEAIGKVRGILNAQNTIPCTACRYCVDGCPKKISIPDLFACLNAKNTWQNWNTSYYYGINTGDGKGKAEDCIGCGKCEAVCPQHLPIRELLKQVSAEFDKDED